MQETPVRFLGWEDPLEKGWATHSSILGLPLRLSWYFPSPLGSQRAAVLTETSPLYFHSMLSEYGLHGLWE